MVEAPPAHAAASARYDARNPGALAQLTANGAQLRAFSRSIMDAAFEATQQLYKELGDKDPAFKALHSSYMGFRDSEMPWFRLTEAPTASTWAWRCRPGAEQEADAEWHSARSGVFTDFPGFD